MTPERAARLLRESDASAFAEHRSLVVERRVLEALRDAAESSRAPRFRAGWSKPVAAAAAGLALVTALLVFVFRTSPLAQELHLELQDGSRVTSLRAGARVLPELVAANRVELRQVAGSLAYDVTPRAGRLFVVRVADARVEVLGTAFEIELSQHAVHVAVSRGRVRVVRGSSSAELAAGEAMTLAIAAPSANVAEGPERAPATASADALIGKPATSVLEPSQPRPGAHSTSAAGPPSPAELFLRADRARESGDSAAALRHLRELLRTHPRDGRATLARFTIGRLELARGNPRAAAESFESCGSALGGEGIAEAALARAAAGQTDRARALVERYLLLFPDGPRAGALEKLAR